MSESVIVCPKCKGDKLIGMRHDPASDTWRGGTRCDQCNGMEVIRNIKNTNPISTIKEHEGKKYLRDIRPCRVVHLGGPNKQQPPLFQVDVYAVLEAFNVTCPAIAHAVKKLLACGQRGKGTAVEDLVGVIAAVSRAIELQKIRELSKEPESNASSN